MNDPNIPKENVKLYLYAKYEQKLSIGFGLEDFQNFNDEIFQNGGSYGINICRVYRSYTDAYAYENW